MVIIGEAQKRATKEAWEARHFVFPWQTKYVGATSGVAKHDQKQCVNSEKSTQQNTQNTFTLSRPRQRFSLSPAEITCAPVPKILFYPDFEIFYVCL